MSQNVPTIELTEKQLLAAELLAADELTNENIAKEVGVDRKTLLRWRKIDAFRDAIKSCIKAHEQEFQLVGIAQKSRRLEALGDRWRRMKEVIEARAIDPEMLAAAGGSTGLLCKTFKGVGSGEDFEIKEVFAVDTALLKEMRETEKQAAQEVGQWVDKVAPTDPTGTREYEPLTDDERANRVAALLDGARKRGAGQATSSSEEMGAASG